MRAEPTKMLRGLRCTHPLVRIVSIVEDENQYAAWHGGVRYVATARIYEPEGLWLELQASQTLDQKMSALAVAREMLLCIYDLVAEQQVSE